MKIGVLTGGGDAPGLNAVIRAVVKTATNVYGWSIVGILDGFEGLLGRPAPGCLALTTCEAFCREAERFSVRSIAGTSHRAAPTHDRQRTTLFTRKPCETSSDWGSTDGRDWRRRLAADCK